MTLNKKKKISSNIMTNVSNALKKKEKHKDATNVIIKIVNTLKNMLYFFQ